MLARQAFAPVRRATEPFFWRAAVFRSTSRRSRRAIATLVASARAAGWRKHLDRPASSLSDLCLPPAGQQLRTPDLAELPPGPAAHGRIAARAAIQCLPSKGRALMSLGTRFTVSQADPARRRAAQDAPERHVPAARSPGRRRITVCSLPDAADRAGRRFEVEGRLDLDALRAGGLLPPAPTGRPLACICGTPDFITARRDGLARWGLPRFDIFTEAFSVATEMPPQLEPRRVSIAGSGRSFVWTPQSGSLLDAAEAAGIALRSGCRVGQCESCAVTLLDGQVARLVPVEAQAGACLARQAVPLTDLTFAP